MKLSTLICSGLLCVAFSAGAAPRRKSGATGSSSARVKKSRSAKGEESARSAKPAASESLSSDSLLLENSDPLSHLKTEVGAPASSGTLNRDVAVRGDDFATSGSGSSAEVVSSAPPAKSRGWKDLGFHFRAGGLFIAPLGKSREVELTNVTGPAQLGVREGPIAGSGVGMGNNLMPALTVGYTLPVLDQRLSLETILALPFTMKLTAEGTLANESLAPTVLGSVPTGVPALGKDLGEVKVLPPVLTAVARLFPRGARVNPYLGLGASLLVTLDAKITNPVLTEVRQPTMEIPPRLGWVVQGGVDVQLYERFFLTADLKYIGGLNLEARVKDIYVRLPNLPLYDSVRVGDNIARVSVDPIVLQLGVGMNL